MNKLFISTYNEKIIIGLIKENNVIKTDIQETFKSHSQFIVPMIKKIITENNITLTDLTEIIVVNGPGSFTGTRLGVTDAKMLAFTLNIPIKTITSIEAIALSKEEPNKIIEITDSKGKYIGIFENNKISKEIVYLKNEDINKYLENYNYKIYINDEINLEKLSSHLDDIQYTNVHQVNPIYIKTIEALNDK